MTIEELRWMTRLFETRNMSKAAETLFVSQPALSQCVRRIEAQLGFKLFTRSNKGLEPTEKDLLFAEAAQSITATYRDFLTKAELADRAGLEELTIGLPPYLSSCCSAEMIGELAALFPDTRFSVMEGSWEVLLDALRANEIQLVYTSGPLELPGVKVHTFGRGELVILLRRGSPLSAQIQEENGVGFLDPRLLQGEPLALTKPGQATRRLAEGLLREAEIPVNTVQESRHIETLYRYAQKGIATAIVPLMADMEDRDRENGLICRIPKSYRAAAICGCIAVLPELDRLIPREVYSVIRDNVRNNTSYLLLN